MDHNHHEDADVGDGDQIFSICEVVIDITESEGAWAASRERLIGFASDTSQTRSHQPPQPESRVTRLLAADTVYLFQLPCLAYRPMQKNSLDVVCCCASI